MNEERKIKSFVRKFSSFEEAEEAQIDDYAKTGWKESAEIVEGMRKLIWSKEYKQPRVKIIKKANLKEERDDFE